MRTLNDYPLMGAVAVIMLMLAPAVWAQAEPELLLRGEARSEQAERPSFDEDTNMAKRREQMVRTQIVSRGLDNQAVLDAVGRVPRHEFVPGKLAARAYDDSPLPIGHGQTISQPYIVALMTKELQLEPSDRVLEVGTGSGYQAAILAELVREVVSLEIVEPLARSAAERFRRLGYRNVSVFFGDGYYGWEEAAPYDAIIVTAAATHVPPPLVAQLKPGGRMVIPVGSSAWTQNLLLVKKDAEGEVRTENLMPVRFVPLTGER